MEAAYQHGLWNDRVEDGYNKAVCSTLPYNQLTLSVSTVSTRQRKQGDADQVETGPEARTRTVLGFPKNVRGHWYPTYGRSCKAGARQVDQQVRRADDCIPDLSGWEP